MKLIREFAKWLRTRKDPEQAGYNWALQAMAEGRRKEIEEHISICRALNDFDEHDRGMERALRERKA